MRRTTLGFIAALLIVALSGMTLASQARGSQETKQKEPEIVRVTITARTSRAAISTLTSKDVTVHEDNQPRPVIALVAAKGQESSLEFAILLDSDSSPRIAAQFADISHFIESLPSNASIAVAYGSHGGAQIEQPFTTDRAAISKALHTTFGPSSGNSGIYESLSDLIRKWPVNGVHRREVLLISSGIDATYGARTQPLQNPGLQSAIRDAQRGNVTVFSIFVTSGRETRNQFLNLNGQGSLNDLTRATGGYFFSQGTGMPVSFRPFLEQIQKMLSQQYLLSFRPVPYPSGGLHDFKVNTEVSGVKLLAPRRVYVPATK